MTNVDNPKPGAIYALEAYAQGKLLDHSGWYGILPRRITPSDIDMIIANGQRFLFVELKSCISTWDKLERGQLKLYEDLVLAGRGNSFAALAKHKQPAEGKHIDTVNDIIEFSWMWLDGDELRYEKPQPGKIWVQTIQTVIFEKGKTE